MAVDDVRFIGEGHQIRDPSNLYQCVLGPFVFVGPFCEIQAGVIIGEETRIQSHTFVCSGVTIGAQCFIGHGVMFVNDKRPSIEGYGPDGMLETRIGDRVSIGSGAVILGGVTIAQDSVIGAGAIVADDVSARATVRGMKAREYDYRGFPVMHYPPPADPRLVREGKRL